MERDLVKRFIKKDGSQRISFYRDEYAENPRDMTDEPLHCEDWSRNHTIMTGQERKNASGNAYNFLCYMLEMYGDKKKIIKILKDNYKSNVHKYHDTALFYDRSNKEWVVGSWIPAWTDGQKVVHEAHWGEDTSFSLKLEDIDVDSIIECLNSETIDLLVANAMTDGIKMMSYSFGYYDGISFSEEVTCDSEGICWLEKDEFLKYSGCKEEYWNGKTLDEIEFLLDELKAWGDNDVYGFVVDDCIKSKVHKEYTNVDKEDEDYEEEEWEESDSCWGYYGDIDKVEGWIFEEYGLNKEDFEEENV
jgi:hypothetical protein